jgi:hypothetical protein
MGTSDWPETCTLDLQMWGPVLSRLGLQAQFVYNILQASQGFLAAKPYKEPVKRL